MWLDNHCFKLCFERSAPSGVVHELIGQAKSYPSTWPNSPDGWSLRSFYMRPSCIDGTALWRQCRYIDKFHRFRGFPPSTSPRATSRVDNQRVEQPGSRRAERAEADDDQLGPCARGVPMLDVPFLKVGLRPTEGIGNFSIWHHSHSKTAPHIDI